MVAGGTGIWRRQICRRSKERSAGCQVTKCEMCWCQRIASQRRWPPPYYVICSPLGHQACSFLPWFLWPPSLIKTNPKYPIKLWDSESWDVPHTLETRSNYRILCFGRYCVHSFGLVFKISNNKIKIFKSSLNEANNRSS